MSSRANFNLGGNTDKAFNNFGRYGLTVRVDNKSRGQVDALLAEAESSSSPVAVGVAWKVGGRSGKHWVYLVGSSDGKLYA
ncbi:MAG: hypothetical protein R3B70_40320 [Polyangiaceae bacterium]